MELPKNVTQIGEADKHCKIYVEDYVVSYMKQLNAMASDKELAVALYGVHKEEGDVSYLFLYGACKVNFLQKESRHLSSAQQQEIEKCRKKYFKEYTFLAYKILNGEMIEGFHVYEQGICRYVSGYSQFYEKNETMLAYMLDVREEAAPEEVNQEKYEAVRKRQDERRAIHVEKEKERERSAGTGQRKRSWGTATAVAALLCVIGIAAVNREGGLENLQAAVGGLLENAMQQRLPDAVSATSDATQAAGETQADTLLAEDKLTEAVRRENEEAQNVSATEDMAETVPAKEQPSEEAADVEVAAGEADGQAQTGETASDTQETAAEAQENNAASVDTQEGVSQPEETLPEGGQPESPVAEEPPADQNDAQQTSGGQDPEPVYTTYVIRAGDTLTGISVRNYGSDARLSEICALNSIADPDDIKVGQKILLP